MKDNKDIKAELRIELEKSGKQIHDQKESIKKINKDIVDQKKNYMLSTIEVIDSFERKEENILTKHGEENGKKLIKNFVIIKKKLLRVLDDNNVSEVVLEHYNIKPEECVVEETIIDDSKDDNYIYEVIKKGYKINGEVLRFAEIVIVKNN